MIHKHPLRPRRQGRIFPGFTIPPEELARREAEKNARVKRYKFVLQQFN
jgi:hypothetical protein